MVVVKNRGLIQARTKTSMIYRDWDSERYINAVLTHYQKTNFRLFQTERVCRRQFQIGRKWKKVIQTGRKHCGKRRNCSLRAISPFPTVFSKDLYCRRQFQIGRKWEKVIQTGRKHCGKRRNCSLRAISPFPTVFSKSLFPRGVKRCHRVGMG